DRRGGRPLPGARAVHVRRSRARPERVAPCRRDRRSGTRGAAARLALLRSQRLPIGIAHLRAEEVELAGALEPFAAIDGDDLAVDIAALFGQQIGREIGELLVLADAAQRIL